VDLGLDLVERADLPQRLGCGRGLGVLRLEEAAAVNDGQEARLFAVEMAVLASS